MSLSFPPSAINGQVYQGWVFDGEKWNPNWASLFVTSVNNKSGALMPADVAGPGQRVLLLSKVVTTAVASIDMFYNFTNQYDQYELDIYDLQGTVLTTLNLFVSTDGSTFLTDAAYTYTSTYFGSNLSAVSVQNGAGVSGTFGGYLTATANQLGASYIKFAMPWTTDRYKYFFVESFTHGAGVLYVYDALGAYFGSTGQSPLKGISLRGATGNITRAVANLYGVVKAGAGGS